LIPHSIWIAAFGYRDVDHGGTPLVGTRRQEPQR
jgi:hypothetical protein